jgi:YhhN family
MPVLAAFALAAAGGALFVASDALIACGLAGISAVPRQDSAVMPTYVAAQFLLAAGFLHPQREAAGEAEGMPRCSAVRDPSGNWIWLYQA